MADTIPADGTAEEPSDFGDDDAGLVKRYRAEIQVYDTAFKLWKGRVREYIERYRNERDRLEIPQHKRYALLWSTIQVQSPALFGRCPEPMVERRWKDSDDKVATVGAEVLNRALKYELDRGEYEPSIDAAVWDYQMAGRGQVWVRKEVDQGDEIPRAEGADPKAPPVREVTDERICIDPVAWEDFGHTPARNWKEVQRGGKVWRRLYMSKQQLEERFGKEKADKVQLDFTPSSMTAEKQTTIPPHLYKLATVYEIWDSSTKKAVWIATGYNDGPLDSQDDPLHIRGFFPCPRPIYSSLDTTSLVPLPDYMMWKDQAGEVDDLTGRISRLIKSCKVAGAYDASIEELAQILEDTLERDMIPVKKWAEFAGKGGLSKCMDFLPIEQTIKTISELYLARDQAKRDAMEINGISDIMRGQNSGPQKTATEARIAGGGSTIRLQDRQKEIQRFCRDVVQMMGELIAESFTPETLEAMTAIKLPTDLERQQAQGIIAQDKAFKQFQASQPPANGPAPGPPPMAA